MIFISPVTEGRNRPAFSRERSGRSQAYLQTKNELHFDISLSHASNINISLNYEFEDINNLGNISNKTVKNHIFLLEANRRF